MIRDGVTFSLDECKILLDLIGHKGLAELKTFSPEQLNVLTELRSIVRSNPVQDHVEQFHE
jgi:hypothetical protein